MKINAPQNPIEEMTVVKTREALSRVKMHSIERDATLNAYLKFLQTINHTFNELETTPSKIFRRKINF